MSKTFKAPNKKPSLDLDKITVLYRGRWIKITITPEQRAELRKLEKDLGLDELHGVRG